MSFVTSATVPRTGQANISAVQTFHIIIPKFYLIHRLHIGRQGIYYLADRVLASFMYILLGTEAYYSSSSSSSSSYVYIQNTIFSETGDVSPLFTSQRKTTEAYHPPLSLLQA